MILHPRFDPASLVPPLDHFIDGGLITTTQAAMVDLAAPAVADVARS